MLARAQAVTVAYHERVQAEAEKTVNDVYALKVGKDVKENLRKHCENLHSAAAKLTPIKPSKNECSSIF